MDRSTVICSAIHDCACADLPILCTHEHSSHTLLTCSKSTAGTSTGSLGTSAMLMVFHRRCCLESAHTRKSLVNNNNTPLSSLSYFQLKP